MISGLTSLRSKHRVTVLCLLLTAALFILLTSTTDIISSSSTLASSYKPTTCHISRSTIPQTEESLQQERQHNYINLNDDAGSITEQTNTSISAVSATWNKLKSSTSLVTKRDHLLILTLLQNDEAYLDQYFQLIDDSSYPNQYISIGLLISDSTDNTLDALNEKVHALQNRWRHTFFEIDVYQKDFELDQKNDTAVVLTSKRATLAKAKNFLLTAALREHHSWVAWVDVKLHSYPSTIFEDLMAANVDVIVPNCLQKRENANEFWAFDRNNWQESEMSLQRQQALPEEELLMEDYNEFSIGRHLLVDMPTHGDKNLKVPLDGVGGTFTLVKANVHREGAIFPPFAYQHHMDTEGFAKMVRSMGYSVYGLPSYIVYHI